MINLNIPTDRDKLAQLIQDDINSYCEKLYYQDHRNHLGASELGEECWRKLWYGFRWTRKQAHDGRMLRLFNVGHSAEPRFIEYLRGIGFEVKEFDENGKQFSIRGSNGHYGGSLDGMAKAPPHYQLSEEIIFLNEFKTNGTGAGYLDVAKLGLRKAKPKHYAQMCQYGYKMQLKYGLYLIENKNDSDITVQIVELDWNLGKQLEDKANQIINSKEPPPRISDNPAFFNCKYCHQIDICHNGAQPEKNCRSCRNAEPAYEGQWFCLLHQGLIPEDFIKTACNSWHPI